MSTRTNEIVETMYAIHSRMLTSGPPLQPYVSKQLPPAPFEGCGPIRLIILGQDPTVKNPRARSQITTVLNLDKRGPMRRYLERVAQGLGLSLDEAVHATNVINCFFTERPTAVEEVDLLTESASFWLPLLKTQLQRFPEATIISLGEPVLSLLVSAKERRPLVRDYWSYHPGWRTGNLAPFCRIEAQDSTLDRPFYPFPHQPSLRKEFYSSRLEAYLEFVREGMQ